PEEMKLTAAPPSIKFALGENVKQSNWGDSFRSRYPQSRMGVETIMRDGFQAAREYERDLKEYNALSRRQRERTIPPRRNLQLDALLEVLNSQRFVHCHSYVQSEILMLMRLAEEFGFRVATFTHILEGYKVAGEMADHGAGASTFADWWAYKFEVYDAIPYNTCLMHERGVITSINSDSRNLIRRLNLEAAKSVQYCGMNAEEAIKLATINPAIQLKIDDRVGSIKVGKDADFVIWDNHPLSIYAKVEQTWIDGAKRFDRQTDARLRNENAKERRVLIQKALKSPSPKNGKKGMNRRKQKEWHCEDVIDVWRVLNEN
ncbi:MAG: amidohydrolase family protein, partial [Candidatus Zixiibacteriota bacterium]